MSLAKARKLNGCQTKMTRWAAASDEELKEDESSSESDSDSKELVGSTETLDLPKDTELELDSLCMIHKGQMIFVTR